MPSPPGRPLYLLPCLLLPRPDPLFQAAPPPGYTGVSCLTVSNSTQVGLPLTWTQDLLSCSSVSNPCGTLTSPLFPLTSVSPSC